MYGKLINEKIEYAPKNLNYKGRLICNPKEDLLLGLGYLPVVLTEQERQEGHVSIPYWEQEESRIVQKWKFEKMEEGITIEDRVTTLEDAFSEFVSEVMANG